MSGFTGTDFLQKKLAAIGEAVNTQVKAQVNDSGTEMEMMAYTNAGAQGIIGVPLNKVIKDNGFTVNVGVESDEWIWAWLEFGTGEFAAEYLASMEPEVKEMARQFYVNGLGKLKTTPYLIPAYMAERVNFVNGLRRILINAVKNAR